jgi:adenosine deaminase
LNNGCCVGFDVMGSEEPMSGSDIDPNSPTSMVKKLQPIITVLNEYENTTLRLHSGETRRSEKNTIEMLKAVKYIADKKNIKLPPPKIRIGHGIHIKQNKEYIKLLKELGCVVEINASSNFALKNVDSYDQIPYKFYLDNDIPIVISTDGHGMYDTTIRQELEHARKVIGDEGVKKLISIEKKVKMG